MENKFPIFSEYIFEIRAVWVDPEFNHATRCVEATRNKAAALPLAYITNIDNLNFRIVKLADQFDCLEFLYACSSILD